MVILGSIFFLFIPLVLLFTITRIDNIDAVHQISQTLKILPPAAQKAVKGDTEQGRAAYAIAVYLIAPGRGGRPAHDLDRRRRVDHRRRAGARHRRVPRALAGVGARDLPRQADRQPHPRLRHHRSSASSPTPWWSTSWSARRLAAGSSRRPSGGS